MKRKSILHIDQGEFVEFSEEVADTDDLEAQARAKKADQRQRNHEVKQDENE